MLYDIGKTAEGKIMLFMPKHPSHSPMGEGGADGEAGGDSACSSAELQLVGVLRRGKCSGVAAATGREGCLPFASGAVQTPPAARALHGDDPGTLRRLSSQAHTMLVQRGPQ